MRAITNYPPIGWKNKNEEKMKPEIVRARVLDLFNILDSRYWFNVELSNRVKSRVALTIEQKSQIKKGSIISVKTRPNDKRGPNFLVDFVKLIEP